MNDEINEIVPKNNYVLCKEFESNSKEATTSSGFIYDQKTLPLYEIVKISDVLDSSLSLKLEIGDKIIVNSTGTKVDLDNEQFILFKLENIAAKIVGV